MAPHSHWLFGHVKLLYDKENFPTSYYKLAHDSSDEYGMTGYWLGTRKAVAVRQLRDIKLVLSKESNRSNIPIVSHYLAHIVGNTNLLMINGREWKIHRDAVTRTFTPTFLKQAQQGVYNVSRDLVRTFLKKIPTTNDDDDDDDDDDSNEEKLFWVIENIQPITKMFTMDCIGRAAFSTDFDCCKTLRPSPVVKAFEFLLKDYSRRMKSPLSPFNYFFGIPTTHNQQHQEQFAILRDFIDHLLTKAIVIQQQQQQKQLNNKGDDDDTTDTANDDSSRSSHSSGNRNNNSNNNVAGQNNSSNGTQTNNKKKNNKNKHVKNHNLLTRLVAAHEGDVNTDEGKKTLIDVMSTILFASYDTTSTTLTFALYLLATHPKIQETCVEEIKSLLLQQQQQQQQGSESSTAAAAAPPPPLSKAEDLVYITAVVKETLRLFPPAFQVSRTLTKPIQLSGGFVAPKNTQVGIPIWVIHHDEEHFPKPNELRPDRWVMKKKNQKKKSDEDDALVKNQQQKEQQVQPSSPWVLRNYREEKKKELGTSSSSMEKKEEHKEGSTILAGNPDAFLPFSTGGRNCPGSRFALQETVIVLANLLKDLKFSLVPGFELQLGLDGIMPTPKEGVPLRVHRRYPFS